MRYLIALFLLGLLAPWLLGCTAAPLTRATVENEAMTRAPALLGPAESYQVEVQGITPDGIKAITITARGLKADQCLVIDPLILSLHDVRIQHPFHLTQLAGASFSARVSESAANYNLRQQGRTSSANLHDIHLTFQQGHIQMAAAVPVMSVDIGVTATGVVRVSDGLRLLFDPKTIRFAGIGIPPVGKELMAERINPVIDLSGLRFTPQIEKVTIEAGGLLISGRAILRDIQ
jgi:hypothetical protein